MENEVKMENNVSEYSLKDNRKYFSKLGLMYLLGTIIVFIVQFGVGAIGGAISDDFQEKYSFLLVMLSMYVISMPIMMFLITRVKIDGPVPTKNKMKISSLLGIFFITYAGMYISNILGNILISIIASLKSSGQVTNAIMDVATSNQLWVNGLIMVVFAPIYEEFLFRKLLIDRTYKYGEKLSIILSGLLFGLYHGNLYQFFYAFVIGCIFAYIYVKSGKIHYTIIFHMIINFLGSIVAVLVLKVSNLTEFLEKIQGMGNDIDPEVMMNLISDNINGIVIFGLYFLCVIAFVLAGVIIFAINVKKISFAKGDITIPKGQVFKTVAVNVGMGIFILFWIGYMIVATIM